MFGLDDAALALIASGAISTAGSLYANSANRKAQAHINDINWQVAAQNNATQINMANTAHQREVADLRAAGLNPILSAGGNGASTPSLTSPRGDVATVSNPLEGLASSARGLANYVSDAYKTQLRQQHAQAELSEQDAQMQSWQLPLSQAQSQLDLQKLQLESQALNDLTTKSVKLPDGWHQVFDRESEYYKDYKAGMAAAATDASNVNWRNNLHSGLEALNSATSLGLGVGRLRHASRLLELSRDRNVREWDKFNWRQQHDQWRK